MVATRPATRKEAIGYMSTAPSNQAASNPGNNRESKKQLPEKPELPRCIVRWFRGFHLNREKSKVTDWATAVLTLGVAIAAFWSAWIFQGQLTETRNDAVTDQRAWLGIQTQKLSTHAIDQGKGLINIDHIVIPALNSGKSPALNIDGFYIVTLRKWDDAIPDYDLIMKSQGWTTEERDQLSSPLANLDMNIRIAKPGTLNLTYGHDIVHNYVLAPNDGNSFELGGQNLNRDSPIDGMPLYIYILGGFNYDDIYKTDRHSTRFCLINDAGELFRFCIKGQSMD
jgi:hypothetical protein